MTSTITTAVRATIAAEAAVPALVSGQAVTITRPSILTGRPSTRTVYLVEPWANAADPENRFGHAWLVTNAPGADFLIHEVLTAAERATAR
ncbi:hypothetical protein Pam4_60 [Pseudanabaena phage Pam4]|nr:hypothetical protein Pam4_60 [Pseudanabaena phage Pam4]